MPIVLQTSVLCRTLAALWLTLCGWAADSVLFRLCGGAAEACARAFQGIALWRAALRRGGVGRAWEGSVLARALYFAANLIPTLLHALYRRFQAVWDGSVAFRLLAGLGENVPALLSWLFLAVMVCPHAVWNNLYSLGAALLCLALAYVAAMRRPSLRLDVKRFNPCLWAFFFMLCVGVLESGSRRVSMRYLLFFVTAILLALLVISTVDSVGRLKRLAAFGCAGIPAATLYGIYQRDVLRLTNTASTVDLDLNANMPYRVTAFFDNSNTFAQVLVMMLGVAVGLLFASRTTRGKLCALVSVAFGLVGIGMTYSRASWIGLAVMICLFVILAVPRLVPALVVVVLAALPFLPAYIYNRILTIFNSSDSSTSSRFPIYYAGVHIWERSPVTGVGLGSELSAAMAHKSQWYHEQFKFPHYHNIYLQLLVELGVLGAGSYVLGFLCACRDALRAVAPHSCGREIRCMVAGCLSGVAGVMVCGLADYFWHYPRVMAIFWLIFGMMLCGVRLAKTDTFS